MEKQNKTHSTDSRQVCENCKKDFIIESNDFSFYKKLGVPVPRWCPHCRFIRKLTFTNERSLYKRECANCRKSTISIYHPNVPYPIWCIQCHLSDVWDASDFATEYDFSRTFFEQFRDLRYKIPHRALDQNERNGEGCEYANFCYSSKNVYLSFNVTGNSENIKYSKPFLRLNKNCVDCLIIYKNEKVYEVVRGIQNFNSSFLIESDQCIDSHFLYDCTNCQNCCLSSNLRNKNFVFKNKQLTKEEYKKALTELALGTYQGQSEAKKEFKNIAKNAMTKYAHIKNSVNCSGDLIENSKNCTHCFGLMDAENVKNTFYGINTMKDCQDLIFTGRVEECYEFTLGGRAGSRIVLSFSCGGGCKNLFYCDNCSSCSDCFGCVGLKKKQYCILNKQYKKEEYFKIIEKIKNHMNDMPYVDKIGREYPFGEYFPSELSPFAYNETIAYEENPLSKEDTIAQGYRWLDKEQKVSATAINPDEIPNDIKNVEKEICGQIIACKNEGRIETQCTYGFKIIPDELVFYKQMNLPIPRYCPNCRYYDRLKWTNPFKFYERNCMCKIENHGHTGKCKNKFETMYAPDRPEIIYCKECYQKEVY